MNILIVGAGVVGSIYGWALSQGGHRVVHLLRPGKAKRLGGGISMDMLDCRRRRKRYFRGLYPIQVTETLSPVDQHELIILPIKHYQLEEALAQIVPEAGRAEFLLLTQNWRGTEAVDSVLSRDRYVYGDAKGGGTFANATLVSTLASIDLGAPEGGPTTLARKVAVVMQTADIAAQQHSDMLHYLWVQYAVTGGLWPALVRAGSLDVVLRDRGAGEQGMAAVRECLEVVARRGVDLRQYAETRLFLTSSAIRRKLGMWMFKLALRYSEYMRRCSAHALGDPTEIKVFYDDLMASGQELGVAMPVMAGYARDIADMVKAQG